MSIFFHQAARHHTHSPRPGGHGAVHFGLAPIPSGASRTHNSPRVDCFVCGGAHAHQKLAPHHAGLTHSKRRQTQWPRAKSAWRNRGAWRARLHLTLGAMLVGRNFRSGPVRFYAHCRLAKAALDTLVSRELHGAASTNATPNAAQVRLAKTSAMARSNSRTWRAELEALVVPEYCAKPRFAKPSPMAATKVSFHLETSVYTYEPQ